MMIQQRTQQPLSAVLPTKQRYPQYQQQQMNQQIQYQQQQQQQPQQQHPQYYLQSPYLNHPNMVAIQQQTHQNTINNNYNNSIMRSPSPPNNHHLSIVFEEGSRYESYLQTPAVESSSLLQSNLIDSYHQNILRDEKRCLAQEQQLAQQLDTQIETLTQSSSVVSDAILQTDAEVSRLEAKIKRLREKHRAHGLNNTIISQENQTLQQLREQKIKNETHIQNMRANITRGHDQLLAIEKLIIEEKAKHNIKQNQHMYFSQHPLLVGSQTPTYRKDSQDHQLISPNAISQPDSPSRNSKLQSQQQQQQLVDFHQYMTSTGELNNSRQFIKNVTSLPGSTVSSESAEKKIELDNYQMDPLRSLPSSTKADSQPRPPISSAIHSQYKTLLKQRGLDNIMEEPFIDDPLASYLKQPK